MAPREGERLSSLLGAWDPAQTPGLEGRRVQEAHLDNVLEAAGLLVRRQWFSCRVPVGKPRFAAGQRGGESEKEAENPGLKKLSFQPHVPEL